jgi:TonB family protein
MPGKIYVRITITLILMLLLIGTIVSVNSSSPKQNINPVQQSKEGTPVYNPTRICDEAFNDDYDFRGQHIRYFDITLRQGCFSGFVLWPTSWTQWNVQFIDGTTGSWVAFWFERSAAGTQVYRSNDRFDFTHTGSFRLQGNGKIRFFSNTLIKDEQPGGTTAPTVLRKVEAEFSQEARRAQYNGTVKATFVVDENGDVKDIVIENSPGLGLDEKIVEALHKWKFKPAAKDGVPLSQPSMATFSFRQY